MGSKKSGCCGWGEDRIKEGRKIREKIMGKEWGKRNEEKGRDEKRY